MWNILTQNQQRVVLDRISFYRQNPHRFCADYLLPHIKLKTFQVIIIYMMDISTNFMYLAARGQGKTFIIAVYCCIRCILYPGTIVAIASGRRSQAIEVLEKIMNQLCQQSPNLRAEINMKKSVINQSKAVIHFKNGSTIKVVTASDSARGNRAHIIIIDEYRMVSKDIIDRVIKKFRADPRHPAFLDKPEYAGYKQERNKEIYASSAWFKQHHSYEKFKSYCVQMFNEEKSYFVVGLPYQLSIAEGLLDPLQVRDDMDESDFDPISWSMEMEALWYGESERSFFSFDDLSKIRKSTNPLYRTATYEQLGINSPIKPVERKPGEIRILMYDVAVMPGKANDLSSCYIMQLIPNKNNTQYHRKLAYGVSFEGYRVDTQALEIRRMFQEFDCQYIVLDTYGAGIGVYDMLTTDLEDPDTGEIYPAFGCYNNEGMHIRSTDSNAEKVIYSVKASAQFNNDCANQLRDAVKRGKLILPVHENDAQGILEKQRFYKNLSLRAQSELLYPYIQTTMLIYELVNLECDTQSGRVKIYEKTGARKDKYSSLSYGNYFANVLERELKINNTMSADNDIMALFKYRAPKTK